MNQKKQKTYASANVSATYKNLVSKNLLRLSSKLVTSSELLDFINMRSKNASGM